MFGLESRPNFTERVMGWLGFNNQAAKAGESPLHYDDDVVDELVEQEAKSGAEHNND